MEANQNETVPQHPRGCTPTQTKHPWRATARTIVAAGVGALTLIPVIATTARLDTIPAIAQVVAVAGIVTRILAVPAVDNWLHEFVPWLATTPPDKSKP